MKQAYLSGAVAGAPTPSQATSVGFPTLEDSALGIDGTVPGPYWFHMLSRELEAIVIEGGLVPATATLTQVRDAIAVMIEAAITAIILPDGVALATNNEHLQNNPPANKAATPTGVRAVRDALQATIEGGAANTRDTLQELYTVLNAAIALRLARSGGTMTGPLNLVTPADDDDSKKAANTEWIMARILEGQGEVIANDTDLVRTGTTIALTQALNRYRWISVFASGPATHLWPHTAWSRNTFPVGRLPAPRASGELILFDPTYLSLYAATTAGDISFTRNIPLTSRGAAGLGTAIWHAGNLFLAYRPVGTADLVVGRISAGGDLTTFYNSPTFHVPTDEGNQNALAAVSVSDELIVAYIESQVASLGRLTRIEINTKNGTVLEFETTYLNRDTGIPPTPDLARAAAGAGTLSGTHYMCLGTADMGGDVTLYTLNVATNIITEVGTLGLTIGAADRIQGLGVAGLGGSLYVSVQTIDTGTSLYTVNTSSGAATLVRVIPLTELSSRGLGMTALPSSAAGLDVGGLVSIARVNNNSLRAFPLDQSAQARVEQVVGYL